jgi:hypothetical protein
MKIHAERENGLAKSLALATGVAVLAFLASACTATSQAPVQIQQATPTGEMAPTGAAQFLGTDASLLQPEPRGRRPTCTLTPTCSGTITKRSC